MLRDTTEFLGEFEALEQEIPVLKTTVNKLIAGENRTVADLFDLTGMRWFHYTLCISVCGILNSPVPVFFVFKIGQIVCKELILIL